MNRSLTARLLLIVFALFASSLACAQSTYTKTKYPVVLVHGLLGDALRRAGEPAREL